MMKIQPNQVLCTSGLLAWLRRAAILGAKWFEVCLLISAFAAAGFVLLLSLHPDFYYVAWIPILALLWLALVVSRFLALAARSFAARDAAPKVSPFARHGWKQAFIIVLAVTLTIPFQLPLRVAFLTIRPQLEQAIDGSTAATFKGLDANIQSPLFVISAEQTNQQLKWNRAEGVNTNQVLFRLANNAEAAFIHSPGGLRNLAFNAGAAGHLMGDWYWMKED